MISARLSISNRLTGMNRLPSRGTAGARPSFGDKKMLHLLMGIVKGKPMSNAADRDETALECKRIQGV
jgi:hypothetical protein